MKLKWILPLMALLCAASVCNAEATANAETEGSYKFYDDPKALETLKPGRPVYQDIDPSLDGVVSDGFTLRYLPGSRALTGDGCVVNKVINIVGVGASFTDMDAITDNDLTNSANIADVVKATVTVGPLFTIKDFHNYYGKGTTVGFKLVNDNTSVLSLDVIKALAVGFYRDGRLLGTVPVATGQTAAGIDLSLINIGGKNATMTITATAPDVFDEISLDLAGGVELEAGGDLRIRYAFCGAPDRVILSRDWHTNHGPLEEGDLTRYNRKTGRHLDFEFAQVNQTRVDNEDNNTLTTTQYKQFIYSPARYAVLELVATVGSKGELQFNMKDDTTPADEELFPAGAEVGFKIKENGLLDLSIGEGAYIEFFSKKKNGEKADDYAVTEKVILNGGALGLNLIKSEEKYYSAVATKPFSGAHLFLGTGVQVDVGDVEGYYAYVEMPPTQTHLCPLQTTTDIFLAKNLNSFQLEWNKDIDVEFSIVSQPEGSDAQVSEAGYVTGISAKGIYEVLIQPKGEGHADCGCIVKIHHDPFADMTQDPSELCSAPLVNRAGNEAVYTLSDKIYESSGSLISISDKSDIENIVDENTDNYALYVDGISIGDNICITGVKRTDGGMIFYGTDPKGIRLGFVVEHPTEAIDLTLLEFLRIRCYYKGNRVQESVIDEANAVSVDLIGTEKNTKMRYSIVVPAGHMVDEFQLWTGGVLDISVSNLKIYYPFTEEVNSECASVVGCNGEVMSMHASAYPLQGGGIDVAQFVNNIGNVVDDDIESYMEVENVVSVGAGVVIHINLGRTVHPTNQVGIIMDEKTLLSGVKAGDWLKVRTYNTTGNNQGAAKAAADDNKKANLVDEITDWNVADVNVGGYGDKRSLNFTPSAPFNELELEIAGIAGVTENQKFYGICTRGDANHNGIADCLEQTEFLDLTGVKEAGHDIDSRLVVMLNGDIATVSCPGLEIARLMSFDTTGRVNRLTDGMNAGTASIVLPHGINVLHVTLSDGTTRSVKLSVR